MPGALSLTEPTARDHTHPLLLQELETVVLVWREASFLGERRNFLSDSLVSILVYTACKLFLGHFTHISKMFYNTWFAICTFNETQPSI